MSSLFAAQAAARGLSVQASAALDTQLERLIADARAAWPGIALTTEAFLTHLVDKLAVDLDAAAAVAALHATDLYLACGCLHGDSKAVALLEERFITWVASFLARFGGDPNDADEVKQTLRTRLLVAEGGQPPRIGEYAGRGPLGAWLRRAALRTLLMARRRERASEGPLVPKLDSVGDAAPDAEILYLKARYGRELDAAFREVLAGLSEREATLLQLYFVSGLTAPTLASMYRVAESTVRRWLGELRGRVIEETRRRLADRLDISPTECQSLIGMLQSQLDISVVRVLKEADRD